MTPEEHEALRLSSLPREERAPRIAAALTRTRREAMEAALKAVDEHDDTCDHNAYCSHATNIEQRIRALMEAKP